jgi:hypothetical protein
MACSLSQFWSIFCDLNKHFHLPYNICTNRSVCVISDNFSAVWVNGRRTITRNYIGCGNKESLAWTVRESWTHDRSLWNQEINPGTKKNANHFTVTFGKIFINLNEIKFLCHVQSFCKINIWDAWTEFLVIHNFHRFAVALLVSQ